MNEITMPVWMFALVLAGTALTASALVGWGMAIVAMASGPVSSPLEAAFEDGWQAGKADARIAALRVEQ